MWTMVLNLILTRKITMTMTMILIILLEVQILILKVKLLAQQAIIIITNVIHYLKEKTHRIQIYLHIITKIVILAVPKTVNNEYKYITIIVIATINNNKYMFEVKLAKIEYEDKTSSSGYQNRSGTNTTSKRSETKNENLSSFPTNL